MEQFALVELVPSVAEEPGAQQQSAPGAQEQSHMFAIVELVPSVAEEQELIASLLVS
jgi:hypothetical protein